MTKRAPSASIRSSSDEIRISEIPAPARRFGRVVVTRWCSDRVSSHDDAASGSLRARTVTARTHVELGDFHTSRPRRVVADPRVFPAIDLGVSSRFCRLNLSAPLGASLRHVVGAEVHAAIQALYGQNAAQQKQANEFLVRFAATPQAWEVSLQLVAVNDSAVLLRGQHAARQVQVRLDHLPRRTARSSSAPSPPSSRRSAPNPRPCSRRVACASSWPPPPRDPAPSTSPTSSSRRSTSPARAPTPLASPSPSRFKPRSPRRSTTPIAPRAASSSTCASRDSWRCSARRRLSSTRHPSTRRRRVASRRARAALAWLRLDERGGAGWSWPGYVGAESRGADAGRASGVGGGRPPPPTRRPSFAARRSRPGGGGEPGGRGGGDEGIVESLCAHRAAALAGEDAENLARAVCRVAVAVSERDVSTLTRRDARRAFRAHRRRPRSSRRTSDPSRRRRRTISSINTVPWRTGTRRSAPALRAVGRRVRAARDAPPISRRGTSGGGSRHLLPIPRTDPRGSPR